MLSGPKMFAIFVAKIWIQSIHEPSPRGVRPCDKDPPISHTKGGSQVLQIRQIPDAVWDEACELVERKSYAHQ